MMKASTDNIFAVLVDLHETNPEVSWSNIVAAVTATGMKITNWLKVRGVLQYCINNKMFTRTKDLTVEVYICNK